MPDIIGVHISPEPSPEDREAVIAAVRMILKEHETVARPSVWRTAARTAARTGIRDLGRNLPSDRRWALSARLPWGGRENQGLHGRGDAK